MKSYTARFVLAIITGFVSPALSTDNIKITAERGLTCDLTKTICTATGNVVTTHKDSRLTSHTLTARFETKTTAHSGNQQASSHHPLRSLNASGNVQFQHQKGGVVAKGQDATFDTKTQELRITGRPSITHKKAKLFAKKYIVFYKGMTWAQTVGRSTLRYGDKLLQADTMRIYFTHDEAGKLIFARLEADGHIVLSTPAEIATAKRGIYRGTTKTVELFDDVVMTKKEGQIHGQYVRYDLLSGQGQVKNAIGTQDHYGQHKNRVHIVLDTPPPSQPNPGATQEP